MFSRWCQEGENYQNCEKTPSNSFKTPKYRALKKKYKQDNNRNNDKNSKIMPKKNTKFKHLYRTKLGYYYYRKYVNDKDLRISLKTKELKKAILIKSYIDTLSNEELLLFKLKSGDYELLIEYDSIEELKEIIELNKEMMTQHQQEKLHRQEYLLAETKRIDNKSSNTITIFDLELKFLENKKKYDKVKKGSYEAYRSTFTDLKNFFSSSKSIQDLTSEDFDRFLDYLIEKKLSNKTINNKISYTKNFFEFALKRSYIDKDPTIHLENLKEEKSLKENFSNEEILEILNSDKIEEEYIHCFYVAAYTGMRISEIASITNDNILEENNIKYFNVEDSKTRNGIRKVPIHPILLEMNIKFPIFAKEFEYYKNDKREFSKNIDKKVLRRLYKVIPKQEGIKKSFHEFRGTVINRLLNKFPDKISIIQQLVGHSQDKNSLTIDTYGKEFDLKLKYEIIKELSY